MRTKLALIVPHTRSKGGAVGVPPLGMTEYAYGSLLLPEAKEYADRNYPEMEVEIFRRDYRGIELTYKDVRQWFEQTSLDGCAAIEPHFNAVPETLKGKVSGSEVLLCSEKDLKWVNERELAWNILHAITDTLETKSRGVKERPQSEGEAGWYNLNQFSEYPSILPELFFGDHPEDAAKAAERIEPLARALVDTTADFLLHC